MKCAAVCHTGMELPTPSTPPLATSVTRIAGRAHQTWRDCTPPSPLLALDQAYQFACCCVYARDQTAALQVFDVECGCEAASSQLHTGQLLFQHLLVPEWSPRRRRGHAAVMKQPCKYMRKTTVPSGHALCLQGWSQPVVAM